MRKLGILFIQLLLVCLVPQHTHAQETRSIETPILQSLRYNDNNLYALATENSSYKSIASYKLDKGKRNLNSSNTYIREATATDARWRLVGNSMALAASSYGLFLPIALKGIESREITFGYYSSVYAATVLASGAIPFVLTMDNKVKRGPVVALYGIGSLAFANAPFIYLMLNGKTLIDNFQHGNTGETIIAATNGVINTVVVSTLAASTGAYFGAKALDIGPGEAALITTNGRWMMAEGAIVLGAFASYYFLPLINDIQKFNANFSKIDTAAFGHERAKQIAALQSDMEHKGPLAILLNPKEEYGLPQHLVDRANGFIATVAATPIVLVGSSLLGCGAGYLATRFQSFTEGDVKIFDNMVSLSQITFAAVLSASGMYKYTTFERALAIQALAYPTGALLNQFIFGKYDFSYNQSRLINIETQLFGLLGGTLGYLVFPQESKLTGALIGTALGANAGFVTYFLGTKKRIGRANYSYIGESKMGFALLPAGTNNATISPGLKVSFSIR